MKLNYKRTILVGFAFFLISAWDGLFNCVNSLGEFIIPPDGCEDDDI